MRSTEYGYTITLIFKASNEILRQFFTQLLGYSRFNQPKWDVESIHSKNVVSILHLLVALARHFRAPVRLPENVSVFVVVVQVIV